MFLDKKTKQNEVFERCFYSLGTLCSIKIFLLKEEITEYNKLEDKMDEILDGVQNLTQAFDDKFSIFKIDSEVSEINRNSGKRPVKVSGETFFLIKKAVEFCEISDGGMDITIGPLSKLWKESIKNETIPTAARLESAKELVDFRKIKMYEGSTSIFLELEGMELDLGSIAKGYCADLVRDYLEKSKIEKGIINLGGNIVVMGSSEDNTPWKVGIQHPELAREDFLGYLELEDSSIVTSGDYERYFEKDGKRLHHIIDPRTSWPSNSEIASVTVISKSSMDGDGLTTSAFMVGLEKAKEIINALDSVDCVIVTKDKRIYVSEGIKDNFKIESKEYKIANNKLKRRFKNEKQINDRRN